MPIEYEKHNHSIVLQPKLDLNFSKTQFAWCTQKHEQSSWGLWTSFLSPKFNEMLHVAKGTASHNLYIIPIFFSSACESHPTSPRAIFDSNYRPSKTGMTESCSALCDPWKIGIRLDQILRPKLFGMGLGSDHPPAYPAYPTK